MRLNEGEQALVRDREIALLKAKTGLAEVSVEKHLLQARHAAAVSHLASSFAPSSSTKTANLWTPIADLDFEILVLEAKRNAAAGNVARASGAYQELLNRLAMERGATEAALGSWHLDSTAMTFVRRGA